MQRIVWLLVLWISWGAGTAAARRTPRIAVVAAHNQFDLLAAARAYQGKLEVQVFGTSGEPSLPAAKEASLASYDLVFAEGGGSQFLLLAEALEQARRRTKVIVIRSEAVTGNIDVSQHPWLDQYWTFPSVVNLKRLLAYLGARFLSVRLPVEPPIEYPTAGFYHPDAPHFFDTVEDYLAWYARAHPARAPQPGRFTLGVAFLGLDHLREQLDPVHALIREIEKQQHIPVPLMYTGAIPLARWKTSEGNAAVDVVISTATRIDWRNAEAGVASALELGVPVLQGLHHYRLNPEEWQASVSGLAPDLTHLIAMSERDGLIEPVVISARRASAERGDRKDPLPAQIAWRVRRAIAWAAVRHTPNAKKRVVLTFHAEGGGKGDVGSDLDEYLDLQGSLAQLLGAMHARGYDVGPLPLPDVQSIARDLSQRASHVGNWAPAELARRVAAGDADLIPEATYLRWFEELPAAKRAEVVEMWGPPPGNVMVHTEPNGRRFLVMPRLEYGNLLVVPHPDWGPLQEKRALFARGELPPNHHYLAFFFWLQKQRKPHLWLSLFSNLVLQGGKMEGPAVSDWTALLLGDLPHVRPTPLHGNGSMSVKRKTLGVTPTFTPSIVYADLYGELLELQDKLGRYRNQPEGALRESYARAIREEAARLRLDRDLELELAHLPMPELVTQLEEYLAAIRRQHMPSGSHVLGVAPCGAVRVEMVTAMLGGEFAQSAGAYASDGLTAARRLVEAVIDAGLPPATAQRQVLGRVAPELDQYLHQAVAYAARLDATPQELTRILDVLEGRYLEPGPINDPVRNPEALPSGRNAYLFDPAALPTREAWAVAGQLVSQMLAQYRARHGGYPRKVGFVLWSGETTTNLGVNEAQMLHLLGVRPVWSSSGRVVDVELIPAAELGRPRIDVFATTSGTYRDHFLDKMQLLDKAVQLAAAAGGPQNGVAEGVAAVRAALRAAGETEETAAKLATARVFAPAVGAYSPNIQFLAKSGDWLESKDQLAKLYGERLGHVYGAGQTGALHRGVFQANLKALDAAAFSRSSNVLGTLEHPMVAAFLGGMSMAGRGLSGKTPEMFIANLADSRAARTETLSRFFQRELRSRYFNPKWVTHMMERGYEGARFPAAFIAHLHLWDATTPELVSPEHWREARDVYLRDKHQLGLNKFFAEHNPYARQAIAATLLSAASEGQWDATAGEKTELAQMLAESAAAHGLACEAELCRNRALVDQMRDALARQPETAPLFRQFQMALDAVRPSGLLSAAPGVTAPVLRTAAVRPGKSAGGTAPALTPAATLAATASRSAELVQGRVLESAVVSAPAAAPRGRGSMVLAFVGALLALALVVLGWWRGGTAS